MSPKGQKRVYAGDHGSLLPVKKRDGEPLWRADIGHDWLVLVFSNTEYRFTPPAYQNPSQPLFPTDRTWSFAELYLDCLANSPKAHKNLRDKMAESQEFAVHFAKIALLINLGRLNTTHAMTIESKQAMRSFHPIPVLMMHDFTRRNLVDSTRIRGLLRACALPGETSLPDNLRDIAVLSKTGTRPTTNVANCIFAIWSEALWITQTYFPDGFTFADLGANPRISSASKANALLWLVHRFLETDTAPEVFNIVKTPHLTFSLVDPATENIDTPEELQWGNDMHHKRLEIVVARNDELATEVAGVPSVSTRGQSRKESPAFLSSRSTPKEERLPPALVKAARTVVEPFVSLDATPSARLAPSWAPVDRDAAERYWDLEIPRHLGPPQTTLTHSFKRLKREMHHQIDPVYESDGENGPQAPLALPELRARVNVFLFPSDSVSKRDIVRYRSYRDDAQTA